MSSLINYPPLESYFNGATFTGEVSLDKNVKIVDFGTVFNDNRYVIDNPFGNENWDGCIVRAETFDNGLWSETGWIFSAGGYGTRASSNLEGIVVQTGTLQASGAKSSNSGSGHGISADSFSSVPCRVVVTKIGGATDA